MKFVETPVFTKALRASLSDEDYRSVQTVLLLRPEQGALIRGTGGLRKMRWAGFGHGKRGGYRIIYILRPSHRDLLHAVHLPKERPGRPNAHTATGIGQTGARGVQLKDKDFVALTKSVRQAGKIKRGQMKPSRVKVFTPTDVRSIRERLDKSQSEFAYMIGVSVATLQNWEQGRRKPEGPARALLMVAAENPKAITEALG